MGFLHRRDLFTSVRPRSRANAWAMQMLVLAAFICALPAIAQTTYPPKSGNATTGGTLFSAYSGTTATYTSNTGQCGTDSFSWQAHGFIDTPPAGGGTDTYCSNVRTSSVNIINPTGPNIFGSAGTVSGSYGTVNSTFFPSNSGGTPSSQ